MFRLDKLTQKAQEALQQAQAVAETSESQVMFPLHLLIALAEEKEGIVRPRAGKMRRAARRHRHRGPPPARQPAQNQPACSPACTFRQPLNQVLERAFDEASHFKDEFVSTEHLLLSIAEQRSDPAGQLLDRAGATHDAILQGPGLGARHAARHRSESRKRNTRRWSATPTI